MNYLDTPGRNHLGKAKIFVPLLNHTHPPALAWQGLLQMNFIVIHTQSDHLSFRLLSDTQLNTQGTLMVPVSIYDGDYIE